MQMSRPPQPSPNDLMRFRTFIAAGLAALASACASHPDSSAPTYVPPSTFENLTCRQLGEEQKRITRAEATGGRLDGKPGDADDVALLKGASGGTHAGLPASLTILPHLPSWTLTNSSSSLGELENASKPTLPRLDFTSPLSMILRSAPLSSVMMSAGVPAGAKMPAQESMSNPVTPASSRVGSSGIKIGRAHV